MHQDDLRRIQRVKVCCRADVRDRLGFWTAVTEDVCARGCRLVTARNPRVGSSVELTLSSDLFPESLDVTAHVAWVSDQRVGVSFDADCTRARALSPAEWVEQVVAHGRVFGPEPVGASGPRLVPAVRRPASASRGGVRVSQASRDGSDGDDALVLPFPRG